MPCSKVHKTSHEEDTPVQVVPSADTASQPGQSAEKPGQLFPARHNESAQTTVNSQSGFEGFENDAELKRLLSRFPHLKYELQLVYGVTIEPGPDDAHTWAKQKWLDDGNAQPRSKGSRSRGGRGRGGFKCGGHRGGHGDMAGELPVVEDRLHGPWTQAKGNKQGTGYIRKLQEVSHPELSEGMLEFVRLCAMRFG